jgi:dipeptidyl aminopeptidase B
MWWNPDSSKVAYLRFDETNVNEYTFPIYNPTDNADSVVPYPKHITMRYPKPGYANPLVSVHVFDVNGYLTSIEDGVPAPSNRNTWELAWEDQRPQDDSIIQEVAWVDENSLIIKEINRSGDIGNVLLFNLEYPDRRGSVVRRLGKIGEEGDSGWIESVRFMGLTSSEC